MLLQWNLTVLSPFAEGLIEGMGMMKDAETLIIPVNI